MKKLSRRHLNAVRKLIERYETITLEEIEGVFKSTGKHIEVRKGKAVADRLTGFGRYRTCILCKSTLSRNPFKRTDLKICKNCIYGYKDVLSDCCLIEDNEPTNEGIAFAQYPIELMRAYRARAKHLQKLLDKYMDETRKYSYKKVKI